MARNYRRDCPPFGLEPKRLTLETPRVLPWRGGYTGGGRAQIVSSYDNFRDHLLPECPAVSLTHENADLMCRRRLGPPSMIGQLPKS